MADVFFGLPQRFSSLCVIFQVFMAFTGENARENGDDTHSKNPPVLSREKSPVVESPSKNMPNNRSAVKGKKRKRETPKRANSSKKSKRKRSKFSRS